MFRRKNFRTLNTAQWQAFSAAHPPPTFQAGPPWALALTADSAKFVPEPIVFDVPGAATMLLPAVRSPGGRLGWQIYSGFPLDGYDVIFTLDGAVAESGVLEAALRRMCELSIDSFELNLWPLIAPQSLPPCQDRQHETSIIDLSQGAAAAVERMDGRTRRMAGQAQRRGVTCIEKTDSHSVSVYYDLLLQSAKRWGRETPTASKRFVEALVHYGGKDVQIWLAHYEGKPIAGILALYGTEEVNVWSAAMDNEYAVLRPHNILHVTLIQAAESRGVRWYNLGSSEGLPGVKRFKDGLGAATLFYHRLTFESPLYKSFRGIRASLTRSFRA